MLGVWLNALISEVANSYAFGPFVLVPERRLLLESEEAVRISPRAFDLLTALVQCPGRVVSKRELLLRVWPDVVVDEGNLKVNVAAIRRALGESTGSPRYIATVVGRGYRFIAKVQSSNHLHHLAPTSAERAGNLPVIAKRIFGREESIDAIQHDLESARLLSIVGPGGVGKTTVALAVARRAAGAFKGGAWLVDLSAVDERVRVSDAVADVVRLSDSARAGSIPLEDRLRDEEVLLLLDNCEHVIEAVATWADRLLTSTRKVKLLTTSREPLNIRGEVVRRLQGLGLPTMLDKVRAKDALTFPAVQLFADRADQKSGSFRLDDATAQDVIAICRRLDGHALAIERVALRVASLGVAGVLDHLERRFHMFDGHHEGPERHRTLTANVDASYSLLSPRQQATLRRLSCFSGAFSLESARAVCGAQDVSPAAVVDDIASLTSKSLLLTETRDGELWYRQTHLTRAFAMEKLIEHGELDHVQRRPRRAK